MVGSAAFFMSGACGFGGKGETDSTFCLVMKWQQNLEVRTRRQNKYHPWPARAPEATILPEELIADKLQ
jgi:hypothetical protein